MRPFTIITVISGFGGAPVISITVTCVNATDSDGETGPVWAANDPDRKDVSNNANIFFIDHSAVGYL
jgi:hypothetical protein